MSVKKGVTFRLLPLLFLAKQTTDFVHFLVSDFPKKTLPPSKQQWEKRGGITRAPVSFVGFGKLLRF